ncbi:MAG: helix-turn-helix domain-containing protein, partial [Mariniphaga sp.]
SRNEKLKKGLLNLLENEKIYLAPELKITELCRELNTNRTYLSNVINNDFQLSFNDLINKYRVDYAVSLIGKDISNPLSLQELADASGFGSLSSFNRAFRKHTGTTVGNYISKNFAAPSTPACPPV